MKENNSDFRSNKGVSWMFGALGFLQLVILYGKIKELKQSISYDIYSTEMLVETVNRQKFSCLATAAAAAAFLGSFFIDKVIKKKEMADMAKLLLLSGITVALVTGTILWANAYSFALMAVWVLGCCFAAGTTVFLWFQYGKQVRNKK